MKKRLLSMLMAVLMIVSLVPAVSAADACDTDHADKFSYSVAKDAAAKQPGVNVVVCNDCEKVFKCEVVAFAEKTDIQKCENNGHNWKTLELQKATCDKVGVKLTYCATCGTPAANVLTVEPALDHSYTDFTVVVKPTCTESGWGYSICDNCKNPVFVADEYDAISLLPEKHTFALEKAVYALFAPVNPEHADYDELVAVTEVTVIAGEILYPASESKHSDTVNGAYVVQYTAEVTKSGDHYDVKFVPYDVDPTHGGLDYTGDAYCPYCFDIFRGEYKNGNLVLNDQHATAMTVKEGDEGYYPYVDKDGSKHDGITDKVWCDTCKAYFGGNVLPYDEYYNPGDEDNLKIGQKFTVAAVAPSCTETGWTKVELTYTDKGWAVVDAGEEVEALGHHYAKVADIAPTCAKPGYEYDNVYACDRVVNTLTGAKCNALKPGSNIDQARVIAPLHDNASAFAYKQIVAPTCTTRGLSVKMCGTCGMYAINPQTAEPVYYYVPAIECVAADELANVVEATCTEAGYTGDKVCKWCGDVLVKGEATEALGHTEEAVEAVAATCTEAGLTAGTKCSVCGEVIVAQEEVPALGHKFENGFCTVCEAADPDYVAPVEPVAPEFTDVDAISEWAGEAVAWAAANGVVNGRDDGSFDPQADVTRAEVAVMLYRLAGEPEVADTALAFADAADIPDWAVKAVAWAVSEGVVNGYTDNTFKANANITRAEFVQMLFNMKGAKVESVATFSDVAAGEWYVDAINWAVENGVTEGMGDGSFGVAANCSREQAVTFLFRLFAE